jgi:CheY-like chemotaxis protein
MEASSSVDALNLLRLHEFDCVMLDNQLGDASGAELLPAIHREALRDCPVIMITGAGNESLAVQALQDGAADYLTKFQLNPDMLVRAIGRALEDHRMRKELDELHHRLEQRVEQQAAAIRQSERDLRALLKHAHGHQLLGCRTAQPLRQPGLPPPDRRRLTHTGPLLADVLGPRRLAHHAAGEPCCAARPIQSRAAGAGRHHGAAHQLSFHPDLPGTAKVRASTPPSTTSPIKQAQARAENWRPSTRRCSTIPPAWASGDAGRCVRVSMRWWH